MEDIPSQQILAGNGAQLVITREGQSILGGSFYVSDEIPRVTPFERGLPGQHRLNADGKWELDELLMDERFVAVHIANKGLFVFTACSHAGLINVLTHASMRFPEIPIHGVLGGFHLAGPTESIIPDTVEAFAKFNLGLIAAAHCTGWRATGALAARFKERVIPSAVGSASCCEPLQVGAVRLDRGYLPGPLGVRRGDAGRFNCRSAEPSKT
jgi:7,8-dihydropterin-6-yl-methyl-4-(beta-D-ribofuranosyl)aminobenzene 5'-phosphate synthase